MKKAGFIVLCVVAVVVTTLLLDRASAYQKGWCSSRSRAEREHGITLPSSSRNVQCRGDAWLGVMDRGASTMFEMHPEELESFLSRLRVKSRNGPAKAGPGDPCQNGYNVWPQDSRTAVPGNEQYGGFTSTWQGTAVPSEMLSCGSPVGDSLHVELWNVSTNCVLVKMYTDWN